MLPDDLVRDGNAVTLPDEPGLGVDISESFIEEYAYVPGKGHVFD
jgi:L-alanine-DL-glutamate epimerase-like enolase superfamily enzyme